MAETVKKEHGFINIVVNNAGIMPCHPLIEHTETEIRNMYEINVLAHFWVSKQVPEIGKVFDKQSKLGVLKTTDGIDQ